MSREKTIRALLVGGPMYDGLYARIPDFERQTGLGVEVVGRLPHPELSQESQVDEAGRGALPVRRSAFAAMREEDKTDPGKAHHLDLLEQTSDDLIIPPRFAAYPDCEDAIWHGLQKVMTGVLSPRDGVREAARAVADIVSRSAQPQPLEVR